MGYTMIQILVGNTLVGYCYRSGFCHFHKKTVNPIMGPHQQKCRKAYLQLSGYGSAAQNKYKKRES